MLPKFKAPLLDSTILSWAPQSLHPPVEIHYGANTKENGVGTKAQRTAPTRSEMCNETSPLSQIIWDMKGQK